MAATIEQIEAALEASGGWQSIAAKKLNICPSALSRRISRSKRLQSTLFDIKEKYLDRAEDELINKIEKGDLGAICFYLKCQGKKRGYIEMWKGELSGPGNLGFHISSSNNTNLPNSTLDNMDGPAGGELFPDDLEVTKIADATSVRGAEIFTYTVSVYNGGTISFTNVEITDVLSSYVNYCWH